jgi:hypothetical protein
MEFRKYDSLMNAYSMGGALFKSNKPVVAMEKIDGSNFSIYVKGGEFKFAKRTGFITEDEELFGWKTALAGTNIIEYLEEYCAYFYNPEDELIFYGEYFGDNVRTSYGTKGDFLFFDLFVNGERKSFEDLKQTNLDLPAHLYFNNLKEALQALPIDFPNGLIENANILHNLQATSKEEFEGWVVRPVYGGVQAFFGVKYKTELFSEVSPQKVINYINREAQGHELIPYLNLNRCFNIVSHGDLKFTDGIKLADAVIADAEKESGLEASKNKGLYYKELMPLISEQAKK